MPVIPEPNSPPEMAAWTRWATKEIQRLTRELERGATDSKATDKGQTGTVNGLIRTISQLTQPVTGWAEDAGFDLSGPLPVQFNLAVPEGMDFVNIFVIGHVEALDMTSGGLAVAQAYLEVSGSALTWGRGPYSASKDAGASVVNNVINPVTGFSHAVTPGTSLLVSMNVSATNPSAFTAQPNNFAILQALAIFSKA